MTDIEEVPSGDGASDTLDAILDQWAYKEYQNAKVSGDEKKYFANCVQEVISEFRLPHAVYHNVMNFATDRYIFHRRHEELDRHPAKRETIIDTYKYLLELKNDYTMVDNNLPRTRPRWRE